MRFTLMKKPAVKRKRKPKTEAQMQPKRRNLAYVAKQVDLFRIRARRVDGQWMWDPATDAQLVQQVPKVYLNLSIVGLLKALYDMKLLTDEMAPYLNVDDTGKHIVVQLGPELLPIYAIAYFPTDVATA